MNYDRKKQEELLYNEKVRQANIQSDNVEMSKYVPLEKDYKYQMGLMKKQLQMILDDNRGTSDLDKQIAVLTAQNKILQKEKEFLLETLRENGILTTELE
tara:strand:- start:275 stop:574 length:300 start_codon:yes stop_codon:yes gene_type:complete